MDDPAVSHRLFIYGNWSAYDELSDNVRLDEGLAMGQMAHLLRLRRAGVRFDGYLMDAFWFARDGAYRTWRKPEWPDGPDRWLDACLSNDLMPGMWFTANTLFQLDLPPKWADSIDAKQWGLCLFEGGFLEDFLEALDLWYSRGVRIFKFDFAEFKAVPAGQEMPPAEAWERNAGAFREGMIRFRSGHPEAVLLGYNGFAPAECMDRSDRPPGSYIDPAWLEALDSIYCGDPRPSDLPCASFWRSVDIYSDCMVRLFESSGVPLEGIDNCAFMAGPTGTCYWRGKAGWKEMLLLSLARGGRIHVAYGDLGLFDERDAAFWSAAQGLYAGGQTESFGGWPGAGEPYGWATHCASHEVATVVNPGLEPSAIALPGPWEGAPVSLEGGQVSIHVAGRELDPDLRLEPVPSSRLEAVGEASGKGSLRLDVPVLPSSSKLRLVVRQLDKEGNALRTFPGDDSPPPFRVVLGGKVQPPMFDRKIWSGLSWWLVDLLADGPAPLEIVPASPDGRLVANLYLVKEPN